MTWGSRSSRDQPSKGRWVAVFSGKALLTGERFLAYRFAYLAWRLLVGVAAPRARHLPLWYSVAVATCNTNRSNLQSWHFSTRISCNYNFTSTRINCNWTSTPLQPTCNHPCQPGLTATDGRQENVPFLAEAESLSGKPRLPCSGVKKAIYISKSTNPEAPRVSWRCLGLLFLYSWPAMGAAYLQLILVWADDCRFVAP